MESHPSEDIVEGRPDLDPRALLASHPLFAELDARERGRLLSYAITRRYAVGDVVFRKGDPGADMSLIVSGQIKICVGAFDGEKEVVLAVLGPGEVFGEMAILDGKARSADAVVLKPSTLLSLQRRDFINVIKRHPEVAIRLLAVLCERLRRTSVVVEDRYLLNFPARLAKAILNLDAIENAGGAAVAPGTIVALPISQKALASMIGCSREALNKQLHAWQEAGLVSIGRGQLVLLDPDGLARIVEA